MPGGDTLAIQFHHGVSRRTDMPGTWERRMSIAAHAVRTVPQMEKNAANSGSPRLLRKLPLADA